jgi:hypothetical protein
MHNRNSLTTEMQYRNLLNCSSTQQEQMDCALVLFRTISMGTRAPKRSRNLGLVVLPKRFVKVLSAAGLTSHLLGAWDCCGASRLWPTTFHGLQMNRLCTSNACCFALRFGSTEKWCL